MDLTMYPGSSLKSRCIRDVMEGSPETRCPGLTILLYETNEGNMQQYC